MFDAVCRKWETTQLPGSSTVSVSQRLATAKQPPPSPQVGFEEALKCFYDDTQALTSKPQSLKVRQPPATS